MLRKVERLIDVELEPIRDPGQVSGFQSPARDYEEERLNILQKLVKDPVNTFYSEADSDAMKAYGISKGTILIIDKSLKPASGMLVVVWHEGNWMIRELIIRDSRQFLTRGDQAEKPIDITGEAGILIWGVVTWSCSPQLRIKNHDRSC